MLFETMPQVIHTSNTLLPTLPQQSTGLSFDTRYGSSPLPSVRSYPNSITNGYLYRTDTTSKVQPPPLLPFLPATSQNPSPLPSLHSPWLGADMERITQSTASAPNQEQHQQYFLWHHGLRPLYRLSSLAYHTTSPFTARYSGHAGAATANRMDNNILWMDLSNMGTSITEPPSTSQCSTVLW